MNILQHPQAREAISKFSNDLVEIVKRGVLEELLLRLEGDRHPALPAPRPRAALPALIKARSAKAAKTKRLAKGTKVIIRAKAKLAAPQLALPFETTRP
jgi:hypothetical protein